MYLSKEIQEISYTSSSTSNAYEYVLLGRID